MALRLGDGVERLPGIGPARARSLEKLGLATVGGSAALLSPGL